METNKLNNYTIDDFLKLKSIIYEYCVNLTQKKTVTSWYRDFANADDLYQDVYIYVYENYFNKSKPKIKEGKFIQIMKNCVYWTYYRKYTKKNNKIVNNAHHYQQSNAAEWHFSEHHYEYPVYFQNIEDNPDYDYVMKGLKFSERLAVSYFLKGYSKTEVAVKFNRHYTFISSICKKIESNILMDKLSKPLIRKDKIVKVYSDVVFLREKLIDFEKVFIKTKRNKSLENDRKVRIYSLYLQGVSNKDIALDVKKSYNQVSQEIFRINKKIKNLCQVQKSE